MNEYMVKKYGSGRYRVILVVGELVNGMLHFKNHRGDSGSCFKTSTVPTYMNQAALQYRFEYTQGRMPPAFEPETTKVEADYKRFYVIPKGDSGEPMVVKLLDADLNKLTDAKNIETNWVNWVNCEHPNGIEIIHNANLFMDTHHTQHTLQLLFERFSGRVRDIDSKGERLEFNKHLFGDNFKFHDIGERGKTTKKSMNEFHGQLKTVFKDGIIVNDDYKQGLDWAATIRKYVMGHRNVSIMALVKVADVDLVKEMEKSGSFNGDIKEALDNKIKQRKKERADEAAESILEVLDLAESNIEQKVLKLRALRKEEDKIKEELAEINAAVDFGKSAESNPNFLPLAKLLGMDIPEEFISLANVKIEVKS